MCFFVCVCVVWCGVCCVLCVVCVVCCVLSVVCCVLCVVCCVLCVVCCVLCGVFYTSEAADEEDSVALGGRRIPHKKEGYLQGEAG